MSNLSIPSLPLPFTGHLTLHSYILPNRQGHFKKETTPISHLRKDHCSLYELSSQCVAARCLQSSWLLESGCKDRLCGIELTCFLQRFFLLCVFFLQVSFGEVLKKPGCAPWSHSWVLLSESRW